MANTYYISLETLAAATRLPQGYLRRLARTEQIPSLDVNGRLRFNPVQVQTALDRLAAQTEAERQRQIDALKQDSTLAEIERIEAAQAEGRKLRQKVERL